MLITLFGLPRTPISAAPLSASGEGGTAVANHPISAAPLSADGEGGRTVPSQRSRCRPCSGEGGTAAADRPIGTPDDALALRSDALPLVIKLAPFRHVELGMTEKKTDLMHTK